MADALAAVAVGEEHVDGNVHIAPDAGKAGAVAEAVDHKIADAAHIAGGTAALKADGEIEGAVSVALADGNELAAVYRDLGELFLLHTGIVDLFDLHADLLLDALAASVGDGAGAVVAGTVLVGIE